MAHLKHGELKNLIEFSDNEINNKILAQNGTSKVILIAIKKEQELKEHSSDVDAFLFVIEGEIEFINNEAVKSTDTVPIFAKFKNPKAKLLPNNTVAVYMRRKDDKSKVCVPISALLHDEESSYVYVVDENDIPHRRNVVLGRASGGVQFINSGLSEGERVVSDGPHKVVENVKIEVAK